MFTLVYFIRYSLIRGISRYFKKDRSKYVLTTHGLKIRRGIFGDYYTAAFVLSKQSIDEQIEEFVDGMSTFWLDCQGAASEFINYDQETEFSLFCENLTFKELVMYYVDLVNSNSSEIKNLVNKPRVILVIEATMYEWLKCVSNRHRRRVLNILKDNSELFNKFNLCRGFDAMMAIDRYEDSKLRY